MPYLCTRLIRGIYVFFQTLFLLYSGAFRIAPIGLVGDLIAFSAVISAVLSYFHN
jgi:hypothetical protein